MSLASLEWGRTTGAGRWRPFGGLVVDVPLIVLLCLTAGVGGVVLYSALGADLGLLMRQGMRFGLGLVAFFVLSQVPPRYLRIFTPWVFFLGLGLLVVVMVEGEIGKGAQRWLDLGVVRFQPSEILKLAAPMMVAWFMHERRLPPTFMQVVAMVLIVCVPAGLIADQPDLGTALLVIASGGLTILLAGISVWVMLARRRRGVVCGARAMALHARLPARARVHIPKPRVGSARHGLQHHSGQDRDRLRRAVRQRLAERHPGPPRVSARAFHGLYLRRHG